MSIIATMIMIYCKKSKTLTCEALLEEVRIQWRLSQGKGKGDEDSNDDEEVSLVATTKKRGESSRKQKEE